VPRKNSVGENTQAVQRLERDNQKVMAQRCANFDRFLTLILTALYSSIAFMLMSNKQQQTKIKTIVKFQVYGGALQSSQPASASSSRPNSVQQQYQTISEFYLTMHPSFKNLGDLIKAAIVESESCIFNNKKLIESVTKLVSLFFSR
jgi:hypothetical protein